MPKSSLCKASWFRLARIFLSRRPPRYLAPSSPRILNFWYYLPAGAFVINPPGSQKVVLWILRVASGKKPLGFLSIPPPFLFLSFSPAVTIFFLTISSNGNKSSKVKYHSLKQLSLGQRGAHYPIEDLVHTEQIHPTSTQQSPCVMSTCHLCCIMFGDFLSLGFCSCSFLLGVRFCPFRFGQANTIRVYFLLTSVAKGLQIMGQGKENFLPHSDSGAQADRGSDMVNM